MYFFPELITGCSFYIATFCLGFWFLLPIFNPQIFLENVSTSGVRQNPRRMTPVASFSSSESRTNRKNIKEESSFGQTISVGKERDINEENNSEE